MISAVMALAFALLPCIQAGAAATVEPDADTALVSAAKEDTQLKFNKDGKFKIVFLTDAHYSADDENAKLSIQVIREVLAKEKPDLVVYGGDNVSDDMLDEYQDILGPTVEAGIPFTFVFGNHDNEIYKGEPTTGIEKEYTLEQVQTVPGCLALDMDPETEGCGNHYLEIKASDSDDTAFVLWMFDTGNYEGVRPKQIEWFNRENEKFLQKGINSIAFQHVVDPNVIKNIYFDSYKGFAQNVAYTDGTASSVIPNFFTLDGIVLENSCPSYTDYGMWDAMCKAGNVLSVLTGHDHNNNYVARLGGMQALQCPSFSYCTYGKDVNRGATVVELDEKNLSKYSHYVHYNYDLARDKDSKLCEYTGKSRTYYLGAKIGSKLLYGLSKIPTVIAYPVVWLLNRK